MSIETPPTNPVFEPQESPSAQDELRDARRSMVRGVAGFTAVIVGLGLVWGGKHELYELLEHHDSSAQTTSHTGH
jgi:hypothetical protein